MRYLLAHFVSAQFIRFLVTGITAAALNWLSRFGFDAVMPFGWAVLCAYGVGMSAAYACNAAFVFPNSDRPHAMQIRDFVLINLALLPVVYGLSLTLHDVLARTGPVQLAPALSHAMAIAVPAPVTFLLYKLMAFAGRTSP